MLRVRWPDTAMATRSGTPARTMFRTAERRRSWKSRSGRPAALHADRHALRKSPSGPPSRWKTSRQSRRRAAARRGVGGGERGGGGGGGGGGPGGEGGGGPPRGGGAAGPFVFVCGPPNVGCPRG